jgi:hypothetical protein
LTFEGLATAVVGPATLPGLAAVLDPSGGYVMLSGHNPLPDVGWTDALVPLTPDQVRRPGLLRVARLQFDAVFDTVEFLDAVDGLAVFGGLVRQFAMQPRSDIDFDDPRAPVRATRYRAAGLQVGFDLPHAQESAVVFALEVGLLDAALERLGPLWPCIARRIRTLADARTRSRALI